MEAFDFLKKAGIPMKKLMALMLLLLLAASPAWGEEYSDAPLLSPAANAAKKTASTAEKKEQVRYDGMIVMATPLLKELGHSYSWGTLKEETRVEVYKIDVNKKYSKVGYKGRVGYVKTECLSNLRSRDPEKYPIPHRTVCAGIVTLDKTATVKAGRFTGMDAQPGTILCVSKAGGKSYTLPVWRSSAVLARSKGTYQAFTPWRDAQPGDLIGGFSTYFNKRSGKSMSAAREYNISLACQRMHDTVLKSGQAFSFNKVCGPYHYTKGYQLASNVSSLGAGYGGGVCQVSTTLYNAVIGLPLRVTEFFVHQKRGVEYVPEKFDSNVGSFSDLKFVNSLPYPIRLWADAQGGALTVLIYRAGDKPAAK